MPVTDIPIVFHCSVRVLFFGNQNMDFSGFQNPVLESGSRIQRHFSILFDAIHKHKTYFLQLVKRITFRVSCQTCWAWNAEQLQLFVEGLPRIPCHPFRWRIFLWFTPENFQTGKDSKTGARKSIAERCFPWNLFFEEIGGSISCRKRSAKIRSCSVYLYGSFTATVFSVEKGRLSHSSQSQSIPRCCGTCMEFEGNSKKTVSQTHFLDSERLLEHVYEY